ncbi:MAG: trimeric intracellular cation channel family protein [Clostridia bacterium]|nr:trimeric intracellular cation channel family protein [Clostridia bacterium]
MNTVILILEIIGTVAFALSGAMVAVKRGMDIFGVAILGLTTACGGGIIRDLLLGITPPGAFVNPVYAFVAIGTAILVFLPSVRRLFASRPKLFDAVILWMDSIGLGLFTVIGIQVAYANTDTFSIFLYLFLGVITGVGGGVMRDVMSKNIPYIFIKHFYATASLIGAAVAIVFLYFDLEFIGILAGAVTVTVLRLFAAHFRWSLPKAHELTEAELSSHRSDKEPLHK